MNHVDASTDSIQLPRLLVSVRNAEEAQLAVDEGVHLIDVKEPRRGSLGAAAAASVRQVADICDSKFLWSVALGELLDTPPVALPADLRPTFVKCGLSGCGLRANWRALWQRRMARYGRSAVAVVYADWEAAAAPSAGDVVAHAAAANCPAVLLDTFDKTRGSLQQLMTRDEIARWIGSVHQSGMRAVVAGSLTREM
ncbi:MAG: (5-formylfuran-3-yl)methyl phosphate synthase, partial [Pirellulales bacterium]|nr:(5-formylfuran-3-yl)methyl phosphate synthase [Pirellulales bacterium]